MFAGVDMDTTLLKRMYGYNNICVYLDFAPASIVLPTLWQVVLLLFGGFLITSDLRHRSEELAGNLSTKMRQTLTKMMVFEAVGMIIFSLSLSVSFEAHSPREERDLMILHTVPFFFLQMSLCALAISATLHGRASGYWSRCGMSVKWQKSTTGYCIGLVCICSYKIVYCAYCWTQFPVEVNTIHPFNGMPRVEIADLWANDLPKSLRTFSWFVDQLFLIFALALPLMKTVWLVFFSKLGREQAGIFLQLDPARHSVVLTDIDSEVVTDIDEISSCIGVQERMFDDVGPPLHE